MIQQQQQATNSDLSRSALDSAQGGVEDAKRALVRYRDYCLGSPANAATPECVKLANALVNGDSCKTIQNSGIAGSPDDDEVILRQTQSAEIDAQLQQAYTCVKIQLNTLDYIGSLSSTGSRMIPLKTTGDFNRVTIEWYSQSDLKDTNNGGGNVTIAASTGADLPQLDQWPANRPAMLRTQLIQFGDSFDLGSFDGVNGSPSNAHTLFLNPRTDAGRGAADTPLNFADDARQSFTTGSLQQILCDPAFSTSTPDKQYACKATIDLPNAIGQNNSKRTAYLRLNSLYNDNTSFRVTLANVIPGGNVIPVTFNSVQPIVDSTGRANSLFRRVQSRVEIDNSSFPFPQSAIDLTSDLCKTFLVTDKDKIEGECSNF